MPANELYRRLISILVALALAAIPLGAALAADDEAPDPEDVVEVKPVVVPDELTMRARIVKITPAEPTAINYRYGGEGLGGEVTSGTLAEKVAVGEWTQPVPLSTFGKGGKRFLTITLGASGKARSREDRTKAGYSTDVEVEFEIAYKGKVLKTFREAGPDGGTVGLVIPYYQLAGREPTAPEFLSELTGLLDHATRRAESLEKLPWAKGPLPRLFAIITNCGGYGVGSGRGVRTTNKAVTEAEWRSLKQLGVNGLRGEGEFVREMIEKQAALGNDFRRGMIGNAPGFPVPKYREGSRNASPEDGCPFAPGVADRAKAGLEQAKAMLDEKVGEVWGLTVDEIGSVANLSAQRRDHFSVCPWCQEAFRQFLKDKGLTPADFGKKDFSEIKPLSLEPKKEGPAKAAAKKAPAGTKKAGKAGETAKKQAAPDKGGADKDAGKAAKAGKSPEGEGTVAAEKAGPEKTDLDVKHMDAQTALLAYYSDLFNNYATGKVFTPLRDFLAQANQAKRKALAAGEKDSPAAKQPWVYSYALRRNTFLMGGGFPDFFEFYRLADNGFVYETSNRGSQVWSWDSYLCDVGRVVSRKMNVAFGIYVKPHRGAPVQRALTAISRNARMIYWYTYGPDYAKGDSFSQKPEALELTSKAAHLIGKAEPVLYGSSWARPAEVAVVNPWSSNAWMRMSGGDAVWQAAWENAKWTYTALAHAHVPVDPLDEVMLAQEDLSRYKVIYVSGPNLTAAAARKLADWVKAGGTLYTSGYGLARDEANQDSKLMQEVLGLAGRGEVEMYFRVRLYGATQLEPFDAKGQIMPVPDSATITGSGPFQGSFKPIIGREVLQPVQGTDVLAKFADGSPAVTRHSYGKGQAYTVGFFPGLEYSAALRTPDFDMSKDMDPLRRSFVAAPALAAVQPVVDAQQPAVEGVLLTNDATGKKAVTLMNWAYKVAAHRKSTKGKRETVTSVIGLAAHQDLKVTIRGAGEVAKVTSAWTGQALEMTKAGDAFTVTLPKLEEGDVLLLE